MKALLITGELAYPIVRDSIKNLKGHDVEIKVLKYPVAALMSVKYILENLKDVDLHNYDIIILPGLVYGDAKIIEDTYGIKTVKGTENAWDIPLVIDAINRGIELSTLYPADKILGNAKSMEINKILSSIEEEQTIAFEEGIKIPLYPPPFRIFLELDPLYSDDKIIEEIERTRKYVDVYVIGFPVGHDDIDEVRRKIKKVVDLGVVVGIDSDSPREIIEGVNSGAKFVFNINEVNNDKLDKIKKNSAFVVAPFNPTNRAEIVIQLAKKLKNEGFEKLILDPVLSPPLQGMVESIVSYYRIRKELSNFPMLMGGLNATELIDADSHGINALLTAVAGELGISSILTMEKGKTRWSSWELKEASKMVTIALKQGRAPKDLGIDLLILKDKKIYETQEKLNNYIEVEHNEAEMDSAGYAKIFLNRNEKKIALSFYGKEIVNLKGEEGLSLGRELIKRVNISPQHALYIGYELAKAEIALNLDKNYIQDTPLFKRLHKNDNSNS
ncbi:dihydropteroate synthase-like protein [Acidianus sulfidivorans JP7]|uniref:Dihydropteroate synthase-like protein n=1 Tax=Acidianus sulfidivorans JP7 TaxID=619593 RepID=A0A2U9IKT3_9CREN|nr:dihydropteroate synthase-like protein [Acidianus sulfidivorans]AWR96631.1 dihydropteroate synthase-like protein [Acidianus sulfidivorans JP7]